jgi:ankyrin repeat protein
MRVPTEPTADRRPRDILALPPAAGRVRIQEITQRLDAPGSAADYVFPDPLPVPIEFPTEREGPSLQSRAKSAAKRLKLVGALAVKRSPRPLHEAAAIGDIAEIKGMVDPDAGEPQTPTTPAQEGAPLEATDVPTAATRSPNERDSDGRTPLHFAACHGHEEACSALLFARADVNVADKSNQTALHFAAAFRHEALVRSLIMLPSCDPTARDASLQTPLHVAIRSGAPGIAGLLRQHPSGDATSRMRDIEGRIPGALVPTVAGRRLAAECDAVISAVKGIAQRGGDEELGALLACDDSAFVLGWRDAEGRGLIHYSACHGRASLCELLLLPANSSASAAQCAACASSIDKRGFTALHYAASWGHTDAMVALLDLSPGDAAARLVSSQDWEGLTPLHCASMEGREEACSLLLMQGAAVSAVDKRGRTAIDVACNEAVLGLLGTVRPPPKDLSGVGLRSMAPGLSEKRARFRLSRGDHPEATSQTFPRLQDTGEEHKLDSVTVVDDDGEADATKALDQLRRAFAHRQRLYGHSVDDTRLAFEAMDKDGDGFLELDEFKLAIHRMDLGLSDKQVDLIGAAIDINGDDEVSFDEFLENLSSAGSSKHQGKDDPPNPSSGGNDGSGMPDLSRASAWLASSRSIAESSRTKLRNRHAPSTASESAPHAASVDRRVRVCGVDVDNIVRRSKMEEGGGVRFIEAFEQMVLAVLPAADKV